MTYRQRVLSACPNAVLLCDTEDWRTYTGSDWANEARYCIGYFTRESITISKNRVVKIPYNHISQSWEYLSGWRKTSQKAWKLAWKRIEQAVLAKLEE